MTRQETVQLLTLISNIWSNFVVSSEVISAWHFAMASKNPEEIFTAARFLIETHKENFAPTPAQIFDAASRVRASVSNEMSPEDVFAYLENAAARKGYRMRDTIFESIPYRFHRLANEFWYPLCFGDIDKIPILRSQFLKGAAAMNDSYETKNAIEQLERIPLSDHLRLIGEVSSERKH